MTTPEYRIEKRHEGRAFVIVDSAGLIISKFGSRELAEKALAQLLAKGTITK